MHSGSVQLYRSTFTTITVVMIVSQFLEFLRYNRQIFKENMIYILDSHLQLVSVGIVHRVLLLLYLKVTCFVYISADQ